MEPKDLVKVWDAPDHSKLNPKQISIRLPILANAKIEALCEMFQSKTKNQIITDLIVTALDQVVEALPSKKGKVLGPDLSNIDMEDDQDIRDYVDRDLHINKETGAYNVSGIYEDIGPKGKFLRLTRKNLRKLEKEAKIEEPIYCPSPVIFDDND